MTSPAETLAFASAGSVLPFVARPPVAGSPGDSEKRVLCIPVLRRTGGFLLALPAGSVPPNLLTQGLTGDAEAMFGPSTVLTVPAMEEQEDGAEVPTETSIEVLVVDFSDAAAAYLELFDPLSLEDPVPFSEEAPQVFPECRQLVALSKAWVRTAEGERIASAQEGEDEALEPVDPVEAPAATAKAKGKRVTTAQLAEQLGSISKLLPAISDRLQDLAERQKELETKVTAQSSAPPPPAAPDPGLRRLRRLRGRIGALRAVFPRLCKERAPSGRAGPAHRKLYAGRRSERLQAELPHGNHAPDPGRVSARAASLPLQPLFGAPRGIPAPAGLGSHYAYGHPSGRPPDGGRSGGQLGLAGPYHGLPRTGSGGPRKVRGGIHPLSVRRAAPPDLYEPGIATQPPAQSLCSPVPGGLGNDRLGFPQGDRRDFIPPAGGIRPGHLFRSSGRRRDGIREEASPETSLPDEAKGDVKGAARRPGVTPMPPQLCFPPGLGTCGLEPVLPSGGPVRPAPGLLVCAPALLPITSPLPALVVVPRAPGLARRPVSRLVPCSLVLTRA